MTKLLEPMLNEFREETNFLGGRIRNRCPSGNYAFT